MANAPRSHLAVTLGVWRALLLREAEAKLFASRVSWIWVLVEPVLHVASLMVLYSIIRVQKVGDLDTAVWVMVGLQSYFIFRKTADGVAGAVSGSSALFAYRQVKPIDTLISRALLEAVINVIASMLLIALITLWDRVFRPDDLLFILLAFFEMWLLGLGFGMIVAASTALVPEVKLLLQVLLRPLYFISGVIFPISTLSKPIREVLMLNPVAHGVEMARQGISNAYRAVPETEPSYLLICACLLFLAGLALQLRFSLRIAEQ